MMSITGLLFIFGTIAAVDDGAASGDLAAIQGAWWAPTGASGVPMQLLVRGATCTIRSVDADGEASITTARLALDGSTRPGLWDATDRASADGRPMPDLEGLYEIGEDVRGPFLRVASHGPGKPRPAAFGPVVDGHPVVTLFRRPMTPIAPTKSPPKTALPESRRRFYSPGMRTTLLSALLMMVSSVPAQEPANPKVPDGDLGKLQGRWTAKIGREKTIPLVLTIEGSKLKAVVTSPDGKEHTLEGEIKLDETATPKRVDWVGFKTPDGDEVELNLGLYKLDGDKWTVCNGGPGKPRPAELKAGEEGPPSLIEFTRKLPEKTP